jgi:hypothetical protein
VLHQLLWYFDPHKQHRRRQLRQRTRRGVQSCCGATVIARNTIVANNLSPSGPDVVGPLTSQGYNLIKTVTAAAIITPAQPTDIFGLDPFPWTTPKQRRPDAYDASADQLAGYGEPGY